MKLRTHEEIRKFVIATIKTGNKERIVKVMDRYKKWLKENDPYLMAQKLFKKDDV